MLLHLHTHTHTDIFKVTQAGVFRDTHTQAKPQGISGVIIL